MRYVILIVFMLFAAVLVYVYKLPPRKSITLKDYHPTITPDLDIRAEESAPNNASLVDSINNIDSLDSIDSLEPETVDNLNVEYYVIVGSFKTLSMAQQKAKEFRDNFSANIIVLPLTPEGYCRISCGKYSTLEDAKSAQKSIGKNICSDAWVYSVTK